MYLRPQKKRKNRNAGASVIPTLIVVALLVIGAAYIISQKASDTISRAPTNSSL